MVELDIYFQYNEIRRIIMKLIDEKGKLFGKINALDLTIVFIVILLCVGTYLKFFALNNTSVTQNMVPIQYDIKIQGSRQFLADALREGDEVFDKTSGNSIGKITSVTQKPAKQYIQLLDASLKECDLPNRYDVIITVDAQAVERDGGYLVNRSYELMMGTNKNFRTKYANATGKVVRINDLALEEN